MRVVHGSLLFAALAVACLADCGSSPGSSDAGTTATTTTGSSTSAGPTSSSSAAGTGGGGASSSASAGGAGGATGGGGSGGAGGAVAVDTLDANRDRLLGTYLDYLKANATQPQTNGLSSSNVASVCELWSKLDPSSRSVYLTITRRLQGSLLGLDKTSMLSHVTKLYRLTGGKGATMADPGSCGDGEYNRMMMSMDKALQAAQVAANQHKGALQGNGSPDLVDAPTKGTFWRDSHDLAGPHTPFDLSDETDQGAPRAQSQYFADPTSAAATAPLGRVDLTTLVDPYALEVDQDFDCVHSSNPLCTYITYGMLCFPGPSTLGEDLCSMSYGDYEPAWKPTGCP